jgi:hypothetical protein
MPLVLSILVRLMTDISIASSALAKRDCPYCYSTASGIFTWSDCPGQNPVDPGFAETSAGANIQCFLQPGVPYCLMNIEWNWAVSQYNNGSRC